MSSPKASPSKDVARRPATPHHLAGNEAFDFPAAAGPAAPANSSPSRADDLADRESVPFGQYTPEENQQDVPSGGCVGISLATVLNTFRDPLATRSLPSSPQPVQEEVRSVFNPFARVRSALRKSLSCTANGKSYAADTSHISYVDADDSQVFECDTFGEKSLTQRAASWGTHESESPGDGKEGGSSSERNVHFHYPEITSLRLRPRTAPEDVDTLFFAPEELEEYEDDRYNTRLADDVETLAVGADNWNSVPTCTSSTLSDADGQGSSSGVPRSGKGASNVMFGGSPASQKNEGDATRVGDKRFVRGVQIMLREKSTG